MKKIIFSTLAIFTIAIGLSYAYADEFRMGFDGDNLVNEWIDIEYKLSSNGGYDVWISQNSVFHYETIFDAPEQIHFQIVDMQGGITDTVTITVRSNIKEKFFPAEESPVEEPKITPEIQTKLDEKIAEREKIVEEALKCVLGIEGSSLFTEYRELAVLEQMIYFKSLPLAYQERQLILWTEECRTWSESYLSNFRQYLDIFKDEQRNPAYSKVLDESDSSFTDPLTEQDFLDEIKDAEKFMCSQEGKQRGLCIKEFEGTNRGGYTEGAECVTQMGRVMCPLIDYNKLITSAISAEENYSVIEDLVCEKFLNQYTALVERIKAGDETAELPNWLAHCEIENE